MPKVTFKLCRKYSTTATRWHYFFLLNEKVGNELPSSKNTRYQQQKYQILLLTSYNATCGRVNPLTDFVYKLIKITYSFTWAAASVSPMRAFCVEVTASPKLSSSLARACCVMPLIDSPSNFELSITLSKQSKYEKSFTGSFGFSSISLTVWKKI